MLLALLACACEKKENQPAEKTAVCHELLQQFTFGTYSTEMTVYDASGKNSALIKIGTDDLAYFKMISPENITLIPVKKGQSIADAVDLYNEEYSLDNDYVDEELCDDEANDDEPGTPIYTMILSTSLADDVENVILVNNTPSPSKGWKYDIRYGYAPLERTDAHYEKATFYGQNKAHVGYYGLTCTKYSIPQVSTLVSNYKQIRTGEIDVYEHSDCLVMTAYLKYKGTNNPSVYVMFKY